MLVKNLRARTGFKIFWPRFLNLQTMAILLGSRKALPKVDDRAVLLLPCGAVSLTRRPWPVSAQSCSLVTHKFPSLSANKTGHILLGSKEQPRTGSAYFQKNNWLKAGS